MKLKKGKTLDSGVILCESGIAFSPKYSYNLGEHTQESLVKDCFVIVSSGEIRARKWAEVSSNFKHNPRVWGLNIEEGEKDEQRLSAVDDYSGRLSLGSDFHGGDRLGYASGVIPTGEASSK